MLGRGRRGLPAGPQGRTSGECGRRVEQRIGVSTAHLSQIERGSMRRPDRATLMSLAELYGLNYDVVAT
ncbi:MAG TPA: helix-turn-helix domain-containing protein [Candidatus Dormibacteraeota bacterium]|nr:helix-turn-helix domain-containing protein [Candidatus Dormibacteraeota bacterium]